MKDKAFELAIVDPPYGIGKFTCEAHTDNNGRRIKNNKIYTDNYQWNQQIPENEYFEQLRRVSKERIIWGANYYNCFEGNKGALVWYKGNMTKTISHCEIASLSFQTKVSYVYIDWQSGFYRFVKEGTQIHPCQKPVALYHWLLKNYAKPGDKILDTHGGSCSIAIACDIMGFDLDVCELDTDYYNAAVERFNRHKQQLKLDFTG
jgi:site-specific DNA-methyltransferase (adenine-specific)